ncbi:MAG: hypothetical protein IKV87_09005 [Methanobrevibacter sp.]|nr:hypothetical protein [Methanobrevibacter sp.]
MEDKKAKFIVYLVVCLIAFICSSTVYSMTGGLSDWIVSNVNTNEDANNNGILDSSEGQYYSSDSYSDSNGGFDLFGGLFSSSDTDNSYSTSDGNPDFLARLLRYFIGGSPATDTSYDTSDASYYPTDSDSNYYTENSNPSYYYEDTSDSNYYSEDTSGYYYDGSNLDELFTKANNKLDNMFN